MTDKQIIIDNEKFKKAENEPINQEAVNKFIEETDKFYVDGVDVSGCIVFNNKWGTPLCNPLEDIRTATHCDEYPDCLYKKYKRKEQECEGLKEELILKDVANIELSDEVKKYRKAIDEIEEIADNNYEIAEMEQIFLIIGGLDV